jgi:hypothetical protein
METNVQPSGKEFPPDCKYLVFYLNPETHYFELKRGEMGFTKVPNELRLEETQKKGLKTPLQNLYFGDLYEIRNGIKKNSFILFHFSQDQTRFQMFFFNHFKLYPKNRGNFIGLFVSMVKRNLYPWCPPEFPL